MTIYGVYELDWEGSTEWVLMKDAYRTGYFPYLEGDAIEVYSTPEEMFEDFELALTSNPKNYNIDILYLIRRIMIDKENIIESDVFYTSGFNFEIEFTDTK